ncbi:MAG: ribonuclease HI, partial [Firmicutes bacterium]|nr:ribonuclease HI [Bacillota bacterium]
MGIDYQVYTDGACKNNQAPGGQPGGWGFVFTQGLNLSGSGCDPATTNNRMEMTAVIEALKKTPESAAVTV